MSTPTSLIIAAIDRSADSTPRPPVWLRSLVVAALGLPCLIGLIVAAGVKPAAPLVAKSSQYASLGNEWSPAGTSLEPVATEGATHVASADTVSGRKPFEGSAAGSASDGNRAAGSRTVKQAPTQPANPAASIAQTSADEIDDIFGITAEPSDPAVSADPADPADPTVSTGPIASADPLATPAADPLATPADPSTGPVDPLTHPTAPPDPAAPGVSGDLVGLDIPGYIPDSEAGKPSQPPAGPDVPFTVDVEGVPIPEPAAVGRPTPDGVPAPDPSSVADRVGDLRELMRTTRETVAAELDTRFPMYKSEEVVTLKLASGRSVSGKIIFLQSSYLMLSSKGERPKIQYSTLHPIARIRCDRDFRQTQISAETEKRVLDALK